MSGVEIAGFVLAAFPLMISALEHYRDTAEVLEGWWKVKREFKKSLRDLKYHKLAFEENLEELLLPLIVDENKLQRLLKDPGGPEWKEPDLEQMLHSRMPKTYSSYLETVESMLETIQGLDDALGMNKSNFQARVEEDYQQMGKTASGTRALIAHVTSVSVGTVEFQTMRIKLAFNKTARQKLFDDFGSQNARLREILGSSDRLAALRISRTKVSPTNSALMRLWKHGNVLYNLLTEVWSCKCQPLHHANLLLQHRTSSAVDFRVIFWFRRSEQANVETTRQSWAWQDTSIQLVNEVEQSLNMSVLIPTTTPISEKKTPKVMSSIQGPSGPRKSFMNKLKYLKYNESNQKIDDSLNSTCSLPSSTSKSRMPKMAEESGINPSPLQNSTHQRSTLHTITPTLKSKVTFENPVLPEIPVGPGIKDLCTAIGTWTSDRPYGHLHSESCKYIIQPLCKFDVTPQKYLRLDDLLGKNPTISLTRRQRFQVAHILASSQIQLHPTPWLNKWSKKDILFLYDTQDSSKICTEQPYISNNLSKELQQSAVSTTRNDIVIQDSIRNLGILLLELCFGALIEEHRLQPNPISTDEKSVQLINYAVATEWARDVLEEAGPEYSDAVTWCLHHIPESSIVGGREEKWREEMFAKVVEPLRYCHGQLLGL